MDDGLILAETYGAGNAGSLEVQVGRLTLTGGAQIDSSTFGAGRGGTVTVMASDAITISGRDSEGDPSGLFSSTFGPGDAGRMAISAPLLIIADSGAIQAAAAPGRQGNAGDIERSFHG